MDTNHLDMHLLVQRIAPYLPDWVPDGEGNDLIGVLRRPDGAVIYLRATRPYNKNSRVHVFGDYPIEGLWRNTDPTITVSPKRAPQDIARDIEMRFLPAYDKLYIERLAEAETERRRLQDKTETTQRLANLLGVPCWPPRDPSKISELDWSEGEFYARVRTENGRVYLNRVSMSLAEFERMVAAIRAT